MQPWEKNGGIFLRDTILQSVLKFPEALFINFEGEGATAQRL